MDIEVALCLGFCSTAGALLRFILKKEFGAKCDRWVIPSCGTASADTGCALFQDIFANALGSFILGLLSSPKACNVRPATGELAVLHPENLLQSRPALLTGLRTGFCGSLTTFSSWMFHVSILLYGPLKNDTSRNPASGILALLIGSAASFGTFEAGIFLARYMAIARSVNRSVNKPCGCAISCEENVQDGHLSESKSSKKCIPVSQCGATHEASETSPRSGGNVSSGLTRVEHSHILNSVSISAILTIGCFATCLGLGVWLLENDNLEWADFCFSGALAPVGALTRWRLSKLNPSSEVRGLKQLPWLPVGTLMANLTACIIGFTLLTIQHESITNEKVSTIVSAIINGSLGSLSTASTWSSELYQLAQDIETLHALFYWLLSIMPAQLMGLVAYGWVGW